MKKSEVMIGLRNGVMIVGTVSWLVADNVIRRSAAALRGRRMPPHRTDNSR